MLVVDHYRLDQEIARGGMGAVFRGYDLRFQRPVAVKLLLAGKHAQAVDRQRFLREAQTLARIHHPNVVAIHAAGETDGNPYLVMDLVEGSSLAQLIHEGGPLECRHAAELTHQLAEALEHVHDCDVLHRDVKPSNVLLTPEGKPKLTDFGLAKDLTPTPDLSKTGAFMGSPGYCSPEQARGRLDDLGPTTDVYSLGATLYHMLSGQAPIQGESFLQLLAATLDAEPPPLSAFNPAIEGPLEQICLKCLEKDTADRYPTASDLAMDLEHYLSGEQVYITLRRQARKQRAFLAMAGGVVLGCLALATLLSLGAKAPESVEARRSAEAYSVPLSREHSPRTQKSLLEEGLALLDKDDLEGAELLLNQAIARDPTRALVYAARSRIHLKRDDPDAAEVDARRAVELLPDSAEALLARGRVRVHKKDAWGGIEDFSQALELQPTLAEAYFLRGQSKLGLTDQRADGLRDLDRALELDPDNAPWLHYRGFLLVQEKSFLESIEYFDQAIASNPAFEQAYVGRARARLGLGNTQEAYADISRAIELNPGSPNSYDIRAGILMDLGEVESAMQDYSTTIELDPNYTQAYLNRAYLRATSGDPAGGLQDCDLAVEINPKDTAPLVTRAQLYLQAGRKEDALADLSRAVSLQPRQGDLYAQRGLVRATLKEFPGSLADLDIALRLVPDNPRYRMSRANVRRAARDGAGALEDMKEFLSRFPTHESYATMLKNYRTLQEQLESGEPLPETQLGVTIDVQLGPD